MYFITSYIFSKKEDAKLSHKILSYSIKENIENISYIFQKDLNIKIYIDKYQTGI